MPSPASGNDQAVGMAAIAFGDQFNGQERGRPPKPISLRLIMQRIKQFLHGSGKINYLK